MADQTVGAASSAAEVEDVFRGEAPTLAEYAHYRQSGELPARFKPETTETADSEPADAPEETVESEGDEPESEPESDPEEAQEPPQKPLTGAEKRIKQLLAEKKELQRKLEATAKQDVKPESSTAQPVAQPKTYQEWRNTFKPAQWIEDFAKKNPEATYEDANAAMADHLGDVREAFRDRAQAEARQRAEIDSKVEEARSRYEDFDDVIQPTLKAVLENEKISPTVKAMLNDSDVLPDVLYALGTGEDLDKLAKLPPGKQVRYMAALEAGIIEEFAGGEKKAEKAPEKPKTNAPKPPSPVTGASSRAFDVSDESLSAEEWMRKRNAQLEKRKG